MGCSSILKRHILDGFAQLDGGGDAPKWLFQRKYPDLLWLRARALANVYTVRAPIMPNVTEMKTAFYVVSLRARVVWVLSSRIYDTSITQREIVYLLRARRWMCVQVMVTTTMIVALHLIIACLGGCRQRIITVNKTIIANVINVVWGNWSYYFFYGGWKYCINYRLFITNCTYLMCSKLTIDNHI